MKALITAFALLSFVAATTVPMVAQAQTQKTEQTTKKPAMHKKVAKKATHKKVAHKKVMHKKTAHKKVAKKPGKA